MYGLTELARDEVRGARLVANPGCYPTAAQLPLIALLKAGIILSDDIIIDAKSGTTGAGRAPKQGTLFCEVSFVGALRVVVFFMVPTMLGKGGRSRRGASGLWRPRLGSARQQTGYR